MSFGLRPFRNGDPPALVRLWNAAGLGRGAVHGLTIDVFDHLVMAQQHFHARCVTVAVEEPAGDRPARLVGSVFFALLPAEESPESNGERTGVIDAVLVHPEVRGRGLGRQLVESAVRSLWDRGATRLIAGAGAGDSPFLVGLYGGTAPAGFLDSDPAARPFVEKCGFREASRTAILQRTTTGRDRAGFQVLAARRNAALRTAPTLRTDRWWGARFGRLDTLRFELAGKKAAAHEPAAAGVTLVGLDLFGPTWNRRAVGLRDLTPGPSGGPPHLHALVLETIRRLREEAVELLEIHADAADQPTLALLTRMGFAPVDYGVTFELPPDTS
ncbi:MAG: GNAT family N-acetyltransferase [Planctomycetota bacterium]